MPTVPWPKAAASARVPGKPAPVVSGSSSEMPAPAKEPAASMRNGADFPRDVP